jgi:hypothetical protein
MKDMPPARRQDCNGVFMRRCVREQWRQCPKFWFVCFDKPPRRLHFRKEREQNRLIECAELLAAYAPDVALSMFALGYGVCRPRFPSGGNKQAVYYEGWIEQGKMAWCVSHRKEFE